MEIDAEIMSGLIEYATPAEKRFFSGARAREIPSFVKSIHDSKGINPAQFSYYRSLLDDFRDATELTANWITEQPRFEGGLLARSSVINSHYWNICPENHRGKTLFAINAHFASANHAGIFIGARPFPVKWHMDHINERCLKRGARPISSDDPLFLKHNAMALAMQRVFEGEHEAGPEIYHPFILPERNGILLGHTMHMDRRASLNRLSLLASHNAPEIGLKPYEHVSESAMTVRTFYSFNEMTPAMVKLRMKLLDFYTPRKMQALQYELILYNELKGYPVLMEPAVHETYLSSSDALADLMKTPLWRQAAQLPVHLKPGLGRLAF